MRWQIVLVIAAVLGVILCIAYCALVVASNADDAARAIESIKEEEEDGYQRED